MPARDRFLFIDVSRPLPHFFEKLQESITLRVHWIFLEKEVV
jgi:hypothetical protein